MNSDSHCTIKIHEFVASEGGYWEIAVPSEIHPDEKIKEFTLDDPGLGWPVVLRSTASIGSFSNSDIVYKGYFEERITANAVISIMVYIKDISSILISSFRN